MAGRPTAACLGLFALAVVVAGAACRHTPASRQTSFEGLIVPIELGGPKCGEGGPSVEILKVSRHLCAKGDTCTVLDERIRNREARPLWLLVDQDDHFAGYLESVSILRPKFKQGPPAWSFHGQDYHTAFRLPAGADIVIRNLTYMNLGAELEAVFFDRITLNHDRHIDWTESKGTLPASGEVDMSWVSGPITDYDSKELYPLDGQERVSMVGVWCTQKLPVPASPLQ